MSNDALERLKKRQRPTVQARDSSLTTSNPDISISGYQEQQISTFGTEAQQSSTLSDFSVSLPVVQRSVQQRSPDISISEYQDNQISTSGAESLVTKQTSIRLEAELLQRLSDVCTKNNLSREVFIEALFEHYEEDSISTREFILTNAIRKAEHRIGIANKKRAKSMMKKFNS